MGPITIALIGVQIMVARMGVVTGKGFAELIREEFGVKWSAFAMFVLIVANSTVTIAEFAGIAAAGDLFNIPRIVSVPVMAEVGLVDRMRAVVAVRGEIVYLVVAPFFRELRPGLLAPRR